MIIYVIIFIIGWGGSLWWDPEDLWPPHCIMCGGLLGGLAAVILEALVGKQIEAGFLQHAVVAFFAGAFATSALAGALSLGKPRVNRTVNG